MTPNDSQFGFWSQRSAIVQMLCFLGQLYNGIDSNAHDEVFIFYLDSTKAFDTVPQHKVAANLSEPGIGGKVLRLNNKYCHDKKQRVRIGTWKSSFRVRLHENKCKILCFKKFALHKKNWKLTCNLIKKISEYKFVIRQLGIKTQAHEPQKLSEHFGISEEIFATKLSLKLF